MTTQQDEKISELSDKNRNLMDAVSRLERELRTVRGLYSRAAKEAFELGEVVKTQQATIEQLSQQHPMQAALVQQASIANHPQFAQQCVGSMLGVTKKDPDNG